jgi:hypothetical protein
MQGMGEYDTIWIGLCALAALGGLLMGSAWAGTASQVRRTRRAWVRVQRALKERLALAPRVVSIATLFFPWNDPLLTAVRNARQEALKAITVLERTHREADLSWALGRLMSAMERRVELARHADFAAVNRELVQVENAAAAAVAAYNREAEKLEGHLGRILPRAAARLTHQEGVEPFDLDPRLAREGTMALLSARGPG